MKSAILLVTALLFFSASSRGFDIPIDPEEVAIYKVLFSGKDTIVITKPDPKAKPVEIAPPDAKQETEYKVWLKKNLSGVEDTTIADYYRRHQLAPPLLTDKLDVGAKLVFADQKSLDEVFQAGKNPEAGWTRFRARFHAQGLTFVSRVGFNPNKTQALVFMNYAWASLGAEGFTILLEKQDGKWVIKGQAMESAS